MPANEWMTTSEVAEALGVSRQTVWNWIRSGYLPARAISTESRVIYRVRRSDFVLWVRQHARDLG
jgi:excisionase family DNA binding protein